MTRRGFFPVLHSASCLVLLASVLFLWTGFEASAAPSYGALDTFEQPDGTVVDVRLWGDEYYLYAEDLAGYTVLRDPQTGWLCYAELAPGQEDLQSTQVPVGQPAPHHLAPGLRLPQEVLAARIASEREASGVILAPGIREPGLKSTYPIPANHGVVRGLALLVDFSDEPATVDPAEIEAFLNQPGYSGGGNHGSVRDYYHDISGGRLDLTHEVTPYYHRAAHPKTWYEDPNYSRGWRARLLVTEALQELARRGFDFSEYDANGDGFIDLVSCFYAGTPRWTHGLGLWPQAGEAGFEANGVVARLWQITPIGEGLTLGLACHEIGHALCQWPDLYDTGFDSRGIGFYGLMSNPVDNLNPIHPCGPLKHLSGWTESVLLDGVMLDQQAPAVGNKVFVLPHPMTTTELYVIENRQQLGRDQSLPDAGLAIWHVDWRGSNNQQYQLPNQHYMVTLVQADGLWDLENNRNQGDDTDLWRAPDFLQFGPETDPPARWWRSSSIGLYLDNISESGEVMTFDFRDGVGRLPVQLTITPPQLEAPWLVTGAGGYTKTGRGPHLVYVPVQGSYLVTWLEVPGWQAPPPATVLVLEDGPTPELIGNYSHPPLTLVEVPALAGAGPGRGGQLFDHDDDGLLDIFLCREGEPDLLLRNDGGWQFSDVTPPALATPGATIAAIWADINGNGLREGYIIRRDEPDLLVRQSAPGVFTSAVELATASFDSVRGAVWIDVDQDGRLDLHLVREGMADLLLLAPERSGAPLTEYLVRDILPGFSFARTVAGAWCDYDGDGRQDLYMVNLFGENVLAQNWLPVRFANRTHGGLRLPWRGGTAIWVDYDNDGDFDLYVVQNGAADMLLTQYDGNFVIEADPKTRTTGFGRDAVWADFNNDGWLDLFLPRHDQKSLLLLSDRLGGWREAPLLLPELEGPAVAVLAGDLDGDGGIDLVIDQDGAPALVLRNTMIRGNWLQVDPRGYGGHRDPFGAVLRAHVGQQVFTRQVAARSGPSREPTRVHFGLGNATVVDSLTITWPSGYPQVLRNLEVNQILTVAQPAPGGTGSEVLPRVTHFLPAYPNPFNPWTNLAFDLAQVGPVKLTIYNVAGRRVATLQDGELPIGRHIIRWDGRDQAGRSVAAGVYLARMTADGQVLTQRLALVK